MIWNSWLPFVHGLVQKGKMAPSTGNELVVVPTGVPSQFRMEIGWNAHISNMSIARILKKYGLEK